MRFPVSMMKGYEIRHRSFAHYILDNATLEELASGFRWIEGLVWMGDAGCLLFQDLPRDRTMRWVEDAACPSFVIHQATPMDRRAIGRAA